MQASKAPDSQVHYPTCAAAGAVRATPIRQGEPGYGRHLDRDGDGIACNGWRSRGPASSTSTETSGSSLRRAATTAPAEPEPITM